MREFWVASGHHLTRRACHGGLIATPELVMAYLTRPELLPPDDACDAERALHASLTADPLRVVGPAEIAALADPDARENWTFMIAFRDQLLTARSLEDLYVTLAHKGAGDLPPIFLAQLCQLILRNALDGCDDPYVLRAAELFYRSQKTALQEGVVLLADAEMVDGLEHAQHELHASPLTALLQPQAFSGMDVMGDDNAWTYWSRSDAHAMAMNLGGNERARAGLCRAIERWISHLTGLTTIVETITSIEDHDWRWFIGLDTEGTRIGNALWNGTSPGINLAQRIVALMRLGIVDAVPLDERVGEKPIYLILATDADNIVRLKPQNLIVGLPLASAGRMA